MPRKALAKAADWLKASPERVKKYQKGPDVERILKDVKESLPGFSPVAGIIRPMAIAKILARGEGKRAWPWLRGILRIPQKELSRIGKLSVEHRPGLYGQYIKSPSERAILLSKTASPTERTIWHEFAHARQYDPWKSFFKEGALVDLSRALDKVLKGRGYSKRTRYSTDPIETHAIAMEELAEGPLQVVKPQEYDELFERLLEESFREGQELLRHLS